MRQSFGPIREETANPRCFPESHGLPKPLAWCDMRHRRELSPHCAVPGLILEQAMPEFKSLSRPFSPPACFCHAPKEGEGLVSLESPAPYGGILTTRVVRIPPRISSPTARYLPAVVLQVWDSASSRHLADFHRSTHIASVVPGKLLSIFMERSFLN